MRGRSVLYGSLAIAAACLVVACGDDPIPTKPSQPSTSPFVGVEVIGPDALSAGESVQFVAMIRQADGTTKSARSMPNLRWRSSDPSIVRVSETGMVTPSSSARGEATITADITPEGTIRGTRDVVIVPRPVVTGTFEMTPGTERDQPIFTVKLTESAGGPATVTDLWITLDYGYGGQCNWTTANLAQTRLPANGTLSLGPLICGFANYGSGFDVEVSITLRDDFGHVASVYLYHYQTGDDR